MTDETEDEMLQLAKFRDDDPIRKAIDKAAEHMLMKMDNERDMLAMFPELVKALDDALTLLWQHGIQVDRIANTLPDRARALQEKSK